MNVPVDLLTYLPGLLKWSVYPLVTSKSNTDRAGETPRRPQLRGAYLYCCETSLCRADGATASAAHSTSDL